MNTNTTNQNNISPTQTSASSHESVADLMRLIKKQHVELTILEGEVAETIRKFQIALTGMGIVLFLISLSLVVHRFFG